MGIHLVTGYAGKEHITAADQGAYQAGVVGPGKYVLQSGSMFEAEVVSNNLVKIKDGDLLNQGRHIHIAANDYEECIIENGTQAMKRNDLIVVRYTKNPETSVESAQILVIKGTPGATAVDPGYVTGDILNGAVTDDFLLYRVKLNGLNITEVETLFATIVPYKKLVEKVGELNTDLDALNTTRQPAPVDARCNVYINYIQIGKLVIVTGYTAQLKTYDGGQVSGFPVPSTDYAFPVRCNVTIAGKTSPVDCNMTADGRIAYNGTQGYYYAVSFSYLAK